MMGKVLWIKGDHGKAIVSSLSGLMLFIQLKTESQLQQKMASDLIGWRKEIGAEKFDALGQEKIGQPIPDWLTQQL
jgi:hypothetical protein